MTIAPLEDPILQNARKHGYRIGERLAERKPTKAARSLVELGGVVVDKGTDNSVGAGALGKAEGILASLSAATRCQICGRELTDPVSIAHGIGPDCIAKLRREAEQEARWRESRAALGMPADLGPVEEGVLEVTAGEPFEDVVYVLPKDEYRAKAIRDGIATPLELGKEPGAVYPKSPDGHSYGYNGSGPNQLALDVLTHYRGRQPTPALRIAFVRRFIAGETGPVWTCRASEIFAWLTEYERQESKAKAVAV